MGKMIEYGGLPVKSGIEQNFWLGIQIEPWRTTREKRRSRRRRYTVAAVVAVLLVVGLYDYLPPLFVTPNS